MNTDIEKNLFPDSHESFDQKKQIDDKLIMDLELKFDSYYLFQLLTLELFHLHFF